MKPRRSTANNKPNPTAKPIIAGELNNCYPSSLLLLSFDDGPSELGGDNWCNGGGGEKSPLEFEGGGGDGGGGLLFPPPLSSEGGGGEGDCHGL